MGHRKKRLAKGLRPGAPRPQDALGAGQGEEGGIADGHDHLRVDQRNVAFDEGHHHRDFRRVRVAIAGGPPGHDVGDVERGFAVGAGARQPDGGEHPVQKLARTADEGATFAIFLGPRCLAQDQHTGLRVAVGEDGVPRALLQLAKVETGDGIPQGIQRLCASGG